MYHVWKLNARRTGMFMLTKKIITDRGSARNEYFFTEPAAWNTRQAAQKYGVTHYGKGAFMVVCCKGVECGMKQEHGQHSNQEKDGE